MPAVARTWVLLLAIVAGCSSTITISRTQEELQQKLAPRFPITKEKLLVAATLSDPKLSLRPDARIGLDLAAEVRVPVAPPMNGRIAVVGRPYYDGEKKAFFLRDPAIETLAFPGFDLERHERARTALDAAVKLALATTPVYTLEERNLKEVTAKHLLKEVHVADGKLFLTLGL